MMDTTPTGSVERLPVDDRSPWWGEHRFRYRVAAKFVAGKRVLDIAAGSGFGGAMLEAAGAAAVVGCDIAPEPLRAARRTYGSEVVRFVAADGTRLPFEDGTFDVVVSFETLEHIPAGEAFVRELRRVVRPDGVAVLSTPNLEITSRYPRNPFHVHEYAPSELHDLLTASFRDVNLHGQVLGAGYRVAPFLPGRDTARSPMDHVRLVAWKIANRLPFAIKQRLSLAMLGRPFYPGEGHFALSVAVAEAHVLVAICRPA